MSEVYREGSLTEQMSKKARDAQDAAKYRDIVHKEEARGMYAAGMEQGLYEQALAQRQAEAARSVADFAQGTLYPQQTQPQGGQMPPRNYVSPQFGEPTLQQRQAAQESKAIPAMLDLDTPDAQGPYQYAPKQWAQTGA